MVALAATWMRGGTSKGLYLLQDHVPTDPAARDTLLLRLLGSPDAQQIDGLGGGQPVTSKVALVAKSPRPDAHIDYLFLQVFVDQARVSAQQNCGNILAGVAPFAIEQGLVSGDGPIRIHQVNSGQIAETRIQMDGDQVVYAGETAIDGVPGTAAPIPLTFEGTAGSSCGALLPTGQPRDRIEGLDVTLIDQGMPCVLARAEDLGLVGTEPPEALEANQRLRRRLETLRLAAGPRMNLGDVRAASVPKMMLVSPPRHGGLIHTRTFIPHRCHPTIGLFQAGTAATACFVPGAVTEGLAERASLHDRIAEIEHPSGALPIGLQFDAKGQVSQIASIRTARKLMTGIAYA